MNFSFFFEAVWLLGWQQRLRYTNHGAELHINNWRFQVRTCHGTHLKKVNDGYISLAGLPYQLKGQYGFHQEVDKTSDTGEEGSFLRMGTRTQNKIGLSSRQNKWCSWSWYSHWKKKEGVDFLSKRNSLDKSCKRFKKVCTRGQMHHSQRKKWRELSKSLSSTCTLLFIVLMFFLNRLFLKNKMINLSTLMLMRWNCRSVHNKKKKKLKLVDFIKNEILLVATCSSDSIGVQVS